MHSEAMDGFYSFFSFLFLAQVRHYYLIENNLLVVNAIPIFLCITCAYDSFKLVILKAHGTDPSVGVRLLWGETLLQAKKLHWSQVGLKPRSMRIA